MSQTTRFGSILVTLAGCATALAALAGADTILVDDDGGPGVDYTDIPPAVAAAHPGDLVLVLPGSYSQFYVEKELTVMGTVAAGVEVGGTITVDGARGAGPMVLSTFECGFLDVRNADSVVVLDAIDGIHAEIEQCADVRLHGCDFGSAPVWLGLGRTGLVTRNARVEIVESELIGVGDCDCAYEDPGCALDATDSEVHFALSSAIGENGVSAFECWLEYPIDCDADLDGGSGADGIRAAGSYLHVSGIAGNVIRGGDGGDAGGLFGECGTALVLFQTSCRLSGVSVSDGWSEPWTCDSGEPCSKPEPDDPTLGLEGVAVPGGILRFRLHAPRGASARLVLGREAVVVPLPGLHEDRLTSADRVLLLGTVPPTGELVLDLTLPDSLPPGLTFYAQAEVVLPGVERLIPTHSVPIVIH